MRLCFAALILTALSVTAVAGEIRRGAAMQVRADSIWFKDAAKLTQWQQMKKSSDAAGLTSYQEKLLSAREVWQFTKPQSVKILGFQPRDNRVNVEMRTHGRLLGSKWFVDADAVAR